MISRARVEAVLASVDALRLSLVAILEEIEDRPQGCPECGGLELQDASVMGDDPGGRSTCLSCGKTFSVAFDDPEGEL